MTMKMVRIVRITGMKITNMKKAHPEKTLKDWIVFFSPTYVAIAILCTGYSLGLINTLGFTAFLVYGVVALAIGLLLQESYPSLFPYLGRNVYHSVGGILIVIGGLYFVYYSSLVLVLFCVLFMFLVGWTLERLKVETLFSQAHVAKHVKDFQKSSHYESGSYWLLSCLLLLLFFEINIAYASILILAIGDTAAGFVGRRMGKMKNPLNHKKTIEGSLAFFATSLFATMLFVPTHIAIVVAFIVSIVEALPLRINDNLAVPLSAGVTLYLLSFV